MMKKLVVSSLIIGMFCLVVSPAMAHDVRPPSWRGQPGSTLQDWDYLTMDNPIGPDGDMNPYGDPLCTVTLTEDEGGGYWQFDSSSSRDGIWAGVLNANFYLPNCPEPEPEKWIRVQVMYNIVGPHPAPSSVTAYFGPGSDPFEGVLVESVPYYQLGEGYNWHVDVWDIVGAPNPEFEYVDIAFAGPIGGIIDHVVIDTVCIPEPATMALLGIGGFVALLKRKRG